MGSGGQTNKDGKYWLIAYKTELNEDFLYITNY